MLAILFPAMKAHGQACPDAPENPQFWVECGQCRGDLNSDGLLDGLDLLVFELYEAQFPPNYCADFNDNGVIDTFDEQILRCLISESSGACNPACGDTNPRSCFSPGTPGAPDAGGCSDASCCSVVCDADPACCSVVWDADCVTFADNLCRPLAADTRPDAGNCLCPHEWELTRFDCITPHITPGCTDTGCAYLVCTADPSCCSAAWDSTCVELAKRHCQSPCTNLRLQTEVCVIDPSCCEPTLIDGELVGSWDEDCASLAALVIFQQPGLQIKASAVSGLLCEPAAPTKKVPDPLQAQLDFVQQLLCIVDGGYCPPAGTPRFNSEISECLAVLTQNYPGCASLFAAGNWDEACIQVADRLCRFPEPLTLGLGDCLRPHAGGGCSDGYCTELVCEIDPTCCGTQWDTRCVDIAAAQCVLVPADVLGQPDVEAVGATSVEDDEGLYRCGSPATGSCCYQSFTPFCRNEACCQIVCGYDDYCCEVRWDELCAQMATAACDTLAEQCTCGPKVIEFGPLNRSCFEARDPAAQYITGCNDAECCNAVCFIDPFCCEVIWDDLCGEGALEVCSPFEDIFPGCGDILAGSCFVPSETPYCDDIACCQNVCQIDPACCFTAWDADCVALAEIECTQCGDAFAGSCLSPTGTPACADEVCCESVCEIDLFCCQVTWDSSCVSLARSFTECKPTENCGDPSARSCFLTSSFPGCSDGTCCVEICRDFDPFCCEVRWDAICAQQSVFYCDPPVPGGTRDPCDVPHATPGCNDIACAAAVCSVPGFETCCTNRWEEHCAQAARAICIGLYTCPGEGDCFTPGPTPLCDDPSCCNVVCTYDPSCCRIEWDSTCASLAIQNCAQTGSASDFSCPCEGSCFEARDEDDPKPGCDDQSCCIAVCRIDPLCCTENWDSGCADLAKFYCGSDLECGASVAGSCIESHDTPFCEDASCCTAVCAADPFCCTDRWDSFCVTIAESRCRRGCGIETAGSCFFPHLSPGCSNAECCEAVCEIDPICCSSVWDGVCASLAVGDPNADPPVPAVCDVPECGDFAAGDPCQINLSPASSDKRCCQAVCEVDEICCDITWDIECVRIARTLTECPCGADWDCGDPCAGDCCLPNFTPKCDDEDCCDAVCAIDNFCCETEWDLVCASMAESTDECNGPDDACPLPQCGDADAGNCCLPNGTPSCNSESCCETICNADPACCQVAWDSICANEAVASCPEICDSTLECGEPEAGPCDQPHSNPYCDNQQVCECVCIFEPFCCIGDWDETCVFLATEICAP
ncbi:MAG: hypothetical protein VX012_01780 [Planctomycetota bacterium]|nr:hypothetical protein [Planctomycetota bacterium]